MHSIHPNARTTPAVAEWLDFAGRFARERGQKDSGLVLALVGGERRCEATLP